jgi:hypothetical protein
MEGLEPKEGGEEARVTRHEPAGRERHIAYWGPLTWHELLVHR